MKRIGTPALQQRGRLVKLPERSVPARPRSPRGASRVVGETLGRASSGCGRSHLDSAPPILARYLAARTVHASLSYESLVAIFRADLCAVFGLALTCGCGSADKPEPAPVRSIDYELFPSTRQLSNSELAALSEMKEDGTLRFDEPSAELGALEVGEVLLAGISETTPQGLLRVVLSATTEESGALSVRTAAAPLQLAFRRLHARVADVTDPFMDGSSFKPTDTRPLSLRPEFTGARER